MKFCPNCGERLHQATTGCPECGARWNDDGSFAGVPVRTPALEPVSQLQVGDPWSPGASDMEGGADPLVYAGFGVRVGARLIDIAVVNALAFVTWFFAMVVLMVAVGRAGRPTQPLVDALGRRSAWLYIIAFIAALMYHVVADAIHGSTPGKMALGLTVLGDSGDFCTLRAALARELAYFIDGLFFGVVAYSEMKKSRRQRRLGDKWAHTIVVRRTSLLPAQRRTRPRFAAAVAAACLAYAALSLAVPLVAAGSIDWSSDASSAVGVTPQVSATQWTVASAPAAPANWKRFEGAGFQIWLPQTYVGGDQAEAGRAIAEYADALGPASTNMADWFKQNPSSAALLVFDPLVESNEVISSLSLSNWQDSPEMTLEEYMDEFAKVYSPPFKVTDHGRVSLGGREAGRVAAHFEDDRHPSDEVTYIIRADGVVYVLTYATRSIEAARRLRIFEKSAGTFAVTPES